MANLSKATVEPHDFNLAEELGGSILQDYYMEQLCVAIIKFSKSNKYWKSFTLEEVCESQVTFNEKVAFDELFRLKMLADQENSYVITNVFIQRLSDFIRKG